MVLAALVQKHHLLLACLGGIASAVVAVGKNTAFAELSVGRVWCDEWPERGSRAASEAAASGRSVERDSVRLLSTLSTAATAAAGGAAFGILGRYLSTRTSRVRRVGARGSWIRTAPAIHRTSLAAFENELGVQDPVGFWDPAGLATDGDVLAFRRRRSVEIKHGRLSMMATMGYITPELTGKLPGYLSPSNNLKFTDVPNGLAAISKVPAAGWLQILAYMGYVEISAGFEDYKSGTPGDYEWKVLTSPDPVERNNKLNAEIANGRLAMVAIVGMFFQDGLTGSAWGDWSLYQASPLRAIDIELGVHTPCGLPQPAG